MIIYKDGKKKCGQCGEYKDPSEFYFWKISADKKYSVCAVCARARRKESYYRHLLESQARLKKWQEENRELHNLHCRNYHRRKIIQRIVEKAFEKGVIKS